MKQLFLLITLTLGAFCVFGQSETWFPYPAVPESLPLGRPRANFIVEHFWDRCPWKTAYSSQAAMEATLRDFADYLPHASADTVHLSVNRLIEQTSKRHDDLAALLRMAEATFHSDTARLFSDEVYLPFARAGASAKKFKPELKQKYAREVRIIESSSEGAKIPAVTARRRDGSTFALNDITSGAATYVLIFEQPSDIAARFNRVRFASNYAVSELVDAGIIKPILICAAPADDAWWKSVASLPESWQVGEMTDAADYFDLRMNPAVYLVDEHMTVDRKFMPLNQLTANCETLIANQK